MKHYHHLCFSFFSFIILFSSIFTSMHCSQTEYQSSKLASKLGGNSSLVSEFSEAQKYYGVPSDIMASVSMQVTRLHPLDGQESDHGIPSMFGVMGLTEEQIQNSKKFSNYHHDEEIRNTQKANIHVYAILLRGKAKEMYPDTHVSDLTRNEWITIASKASGLNHSQAEYTFQKELHRILDQGFIAKDIEKKVLILEKTNRSFFDELFIQKQAQQADLPGILWDSADPNNYTVANRQPDPSLKIIVHTMQGYYAGAIAWFKNPNNNYQTSAHYVMRASDGEITQMVLHKDIAHHVGKKNPISIGIEHEGYVAEPDTWYTDFVYQRSAELVRGIASQMNIPLDRDHIVSHHEICTELYGQCSNSPVFGCHYDPGCGWNWDKYMNEILSGVEDTRAVLKGVVYAGDDLTKVQSEATVSIDDQSFTTDSNGYYEFFLAEGDYTLTVQKAGYQASQQSVHVNAKEEKLLNISIIPVDNEDEVETHDDNDNNLPQTMLALPIIKEPQNGYTITSLFPLIGFIQPVTLITQKNISYEFEFYSDSKLSERVEWVFVRPTEKAQLFFLFPSASLKSDSAYYWRARTTQGSVAGEWTETYTFNTPAISMTASPSFQANSPKHAETLDQFPFNQPPSIPQFSKIEILPYTIQQVNVYANPSIDENRDFIQYEIQISKTMNFIDLIESSPFISEKNHEVVFTISSLLDSGKEYYARIRAKDNRVFSFWSEPYPFLVIPTTDDNGNSFQDQVSIPAKVQKSNNGKGGCNHLASSEQNSSILNFLILCIIFAFRKHYALKN